MGRVVILSKNQAITKGVTIERMRDGTKARRESGSGAYGTRAHREFSNNVVIRKQRFA
jgi:hypothetical protein